MHHELAKAVRAELADVQQAWNQNRISDAFHHAERAHILGQRYLLPHAKSHWWMLRIGWKRRDGREVTGQLLRIVAVLPGFVTGWIPKGNTGGANVSALRPMQIPDDLKPLADFSVGKDVLKRGLLFAIAVAIAATISVALTPWRE
jgi:hypothetical protein